MQRNIIIILVLSLVIFVNCKDVKKSKEPEKKNSKILIQDFEEFFEVFKMAVKERDKNTIEQLAGDNFRYSTNDEREKLSRSEAIEQFDFDLVGKLLLEGYTELIKSRYAFSPQEEKIVKYGYAIYFNNQGEGWRIQKIFKGPIENPGYFNH